MLLRTLCSSRAKLWVFTYMHRRGSCWGYELVPSPGQASSETAWEK